MSCPIPSVLSLVESLGDNCELGFYLRENGNETGSLLRWAITPLEKLIAFIERDYSRSSFEFDHLVPSSPGMVRDTSTGFCFHTAMRSELKSGSFVFEHDEEQRRKLYATEKEKYDFLLARFEKSLAGTEIRIFFIKANNDLPKDGIERLHKAIAHRKKQGKFVLVALYSTGENAFNADLQWLNDTLCVAQINRFSPYAQAFDIDTDAWDRLFEKLGESPLVQQFIEQQSNDESTKSSNVDYDWNRNCDIETKNELSYRLAKSMASPDEFDTFIEFLEKSDKAYFRRIGGDIYKAVCRGDDKRAIENLDDRYLFLIQLYASFDLDEAIRFHQSSEAIYKNSGNSFVRYSRLSNSLSKTKTLLNDFNNRSLETVSIFPKYDASFDTEEIQLAEASKYFTRAKNTQAKRVEISLTQARERTFMQSSFRDDTELSENMWINGILTSDIDKLTFYSLPNVRICHQPTGISFEEDGEHRFVYSMSDMYHYFRVAGKTTFGSQEQHFKQAYVLPRYGINNYYHSLVDKLPGLYGYKLMNLDCPILSTYELDDAERHFAEMLGINADKIIVDLKGEATAENGILPNIGGLRPLFFDYLADLPKGQSPVGPQIYITRQRSTDRVMGNESEVHKIVEQHGFDIVAMEDYSLEDQIAIASGAETIVAPHGAGLANMVFARKDTKIVELIPDRYMTPLFKQLSIDCGHRYSVLIGKVEQDGAKVANDLRWNANLNGLESVLEEVAL